VRGVAGERPDGGDVGLVHQVRGGTCVRSGRERAWRLRGGLLDVRIGDARDVSGDLSLFRNTTAGEADRPPRKAA
jgi:hypothetical protein